MSTKIAKQALADLLSSSSSSVSRKEKKQTDQAATTVTVVKKSNKQIAAQKRKDRSVVAADGLPTARSGLKKAKLSKKYAGSEAARIENSKSDVAALTDIERLRREQKASQDRLEKNLEYYVSSSNIGSSSELRAKVLRGLSTGAAAKASKRASSTSAGTKARRKGFGDGFFSDSDSD